MSFSLKKLQATDLIGLASIGIICAVLFSLFGSTGQEGWDPEWRKIYSEIEYPNFGNRRHFYSWLFIWMVLIFADSTVKSLNLRTKSLVLLTTIATLVVSMVIYQIPNYTGSPDWLFWTFRISSWVLIFCWIAIFSRLIFPNKNLLSTGGVAWAIAGVMQITHWISNYFYEQIVPAIFSGCAFLLSSLNPDGPILHFNPETMFFNYGNYSSQIVLYCAGGEGIGMVIAMCCGLGWLFRKEFTLLRFTMLISSSAALSWLLNIVRLSILLYVGEAVDVRLAVNGFHNHLGWLLNLLVVGIVFFSIRRTRAVEKLQFSGLKTSVWRIATTKYIGPLMFFLAISLVVGMASRNSDVPYYLERVIATLAFTFLLWQGWRFKNRVFENRKEILFGAAAGVLCFVVWVTIAYLFHSSEPGKVYEGGREIFAWAIGSSLVIPLIEELAFRGYLLRRIMSGHHFAKLSYNQISIGALLITSVAFALGHDKIFAGFLAGLIFGFVAIKSNKLQTAIVAHVTANALIAISVLLTGHWFLI